MGYRLSAHAEGLAGCEAAVAVGADTIEHGIFLHRRPGLLDAMAASGQVLVPTLSGYYWMAGLGDAVDPATAQRAPEMPRPSWWAWPIRTWRTARPRCGPRGTRGSRSRLAATWRSRWRWRPSG